METRDFICLCLGVNSAKIDEICDNFDVDIKESDFERIYLNHHYDYDKVGNALIVDLYAKIIENAVKKLGLKIREFDYYVNGGDSHLYYNKQTVNCWGDLEYISKTEEE